MNTHAIRHFFQTATALALGVALSSCATMSGGPPTGSEEKPGEAEQAAMKAIGARVPGLIVWSSSRVGNHDLYVMNTDGSNTHNITSGDAVDWFPRFSPDGSKILFCRSKKGWVSERDANNSDKWDLYTIKPDGTELTKVVDSASWGSWVGGSNEDIIYVRGMKVLRSKLGSKDETVLADSEGVKALDGALLQQPELSKDGRFVAITLRGAKRETGIWDIEKKTWRTTGQGCQINWTPDGQDIYWVNPTGNGGSEVYREPIQDGKPAKELSEEALRFMDVPGRRSHEYFPQLSRDGQWMVWGVTQRGHDHDIADYEIYLWHVGDKQEDAVRLTYHSANDRWPDIFIPGANAPATTEPASEAEPAKTEAPKAKAPTKRAHKK